MRVKTKFYGYRAPKTAEDRRISRLKRACGCKNNSQLFQFALAKMEEIFLPQTVESVDDLITVENNK